MRKTVPTRGRPPKPRGDVVDITYPAKISANILEDLKKQKKMTGVPVATQIRKYVEDGHAGKTQIHPSQISTDSTRLKFLTKAPCGDWREALDIADSFTLSADVATALEANPEDVIVQADGDSMEGARIMDGDMILMRPLPQGRRPARGEIALVQVTYSDGTCDGMIKRWAKNDPPRLEDGDGNPVEIPENISEIKAVAVARGLIARLF